MFLRNYWLMPTSVAIDRSGFLGMGNVSVLTHMHSQECRRDSNAGGLRIPDK